MAKILIDEWDKKLAGERNIAHVGLSRAVTYADVKRQEERPRQLDDLSSIVQQTHEDWVQRIDPVGLGLSDDKLSQIPSHKIRKFSQPTIICYLPETMNLLKKYGSTIVLDGTHGLTKTHYTTVFLVVYDGRGVGEQPAAHNANSS